MTLFDSSTTIVARATPPGRGSVAIVRLSGPRSFEIADQLFHPFSDPPLFSEHPPRTFIFGALTIPASESTDHPIDQPLAVRFTAPHSFTGDDVVELHLHGNPFLVELVIDACIHLGAYPAGPGEFSRRAFINGKMDLTQVEALASLIASESRQALSTSQGRLSGDLHQRIRSFRNELVRFLSLLELELDFVEEGYSLAPLNELNTSLRSFHLFVKSILSDTGRSRTTSQGPRILIAGKPNAGKSSLFNALLGQTRAIVSDIPGTTRDYLESTLFFDGTLYHVYDTAGIRMTTDPVEESGIESVHRLLHDIDYLLFLVDSSLPPSAFNEALRDAIDFIPSNSSIHLFPFLILSKSDQTASSISAVSHIDAIAGSFIETLSISTSNPSSITHLLTTLHHHALKHLHPSHGVATERQRSIFLQLDDQFSTLLSSDLLRSDHIDTEILSFEIRQILASLDELSGATISEDVLDFVFSQFCIGK